MSPCCSALKMRPTQPSGCGRRREERLQLDAIPQVLQTTDETALHQLPIALVEIVGSEVVVLVPVRQQLIGDDQQAVTNRDGRLLLTATSCEPAILCRQVRAPGAADRL